MMRARYCRIFWAATAVFVILTEALIGGADEGKIPITTSSEEARALFIKGCDLIDKMRSGEAREYFRKAVAADPDFALAHMHLALVQPSAKELFESFSRALELTDNASRGEKLIILAGQAAFNAETMKQEEYLKELAALYPEDERARNLLGTYYFGIQDYALAIQEYERAIRINPEFSAPYNQLGYSLRFTGKYETAEKMFRTYIELIPDDPNPYDSYAELLLEMGDFDKSIEYYRRALKIDPEFAASYLGIATNYNLMGKHQTAREELEKFMGMARDDGQKRMAIFATAVSFVDEGKLSEALECLRKQYSVAEDFEDISSMANDLNTMGTILLEMGRYDEAMLNFKKSVKMIESSNLFQELIDNARRTFLYNSARVALMKGDLAEAHQKAEKYRTLAISLNNPFQIRLAHELAGNIALAEQEYNRAIEELKQSNLQNPYNHYRLALAYRGAGDKEKAREACHKAAHYNALNNMNYAFIRVRAEQLLKSL